MLRQIKTGSNQKPKATSLRILSLRLSRELGAFYAEERGASGSVDNVMIIFVAAIILLGLVTLFNTEVWTTVTERIGELMGQGIR